MSDEINTQISAFVDDELASEEAELLIRRLCRDENLRDTASRYTLIGEALRGTPVAPVNADLAARVASSLTDQPNPAVGAVARTETGSPLRRRTLFAAAAAAAVAAVALFTLPGQQAAVPGTSPVQVADGTDVPTAPAPVVSVADTGGTSADLGGARQAAEDVREGRVRQVSAASVTVPAMVPAERHPAEMRTRLNSYLLQHIASSAPQRGAIGYRNVGYQSAQIAQEPEERR